MSTAVQIGEAISALVGRFAGRLVQPADPERDSIRRIHNGLIDRRPALIARCAGVADVIAAVALARAHGLEIAVRGSGHSLAGRSTVDDGLVIDLSLMRGVIVDPGARVALLKLVPPGSLRSGNPGLRSRRCGRCHVDHRHRRAHPRRRSGLLDRKMRARHRQPAVGANRHRGRPRAPDQRHRAPRSLLGASRWRRQLWHRHDVRVRLHSIGPIVTGGSWPTPSTVHPTCCAVSGSRARGAGRIDHRRRAAPRPRRLKDRGAGRVPLRQSRRWCPCG